MKQNAKLTTAVQAELGCTKAEAEKAITAVLGSVKSISSSTYYPRIWNFLNER